MYVDQIFPGTLLHVSRDSCQPYDERALSDSNFRNHFFDYMIDDIVLSDTYILILAAVRDHTYNKLLILTESKRTCVLLFANSWLDVAALEPIAVTS